MPFTGTSFTVIVPSQISVMSNVVAAARRGQK
jgi:hypothetical protein